MPFVVYKALKGLIRSLLALGGLFPSVLFFVLCSPRLPVFDLLAMQVMA